MSLVERRDTKEGHDEEGVETHEGVDVDGRMRTRGESCSSALLLAYVDKEVVYLYKIICPLFT